MPKCRHLQEEKSIEHVINARFSLFIYLHVYLLDVIPQANMICRYPKWLLNLRHHNAHPSVSILSGIKIKKKNFAKKPSTFCNSFMFMLVWFCYLALINTLLYTFDSSHLTYMFLKNFKGRVNRIMCNKGCSKDPSGFSAKNICNFGC